MLKRFLLFLLFTALLAECFSWGFFAHKMINRLAVFTLPEELLVFYKPNLEFITQHAVDPDRRRYSDPDEAVRHYMDMDYYEVSAPVDSVPLYWKEAVKRYTEDTLKTYGIVPWHVNVMVFRLTDAFKARDAYKILRTSAELGHYVADACVPLHATMNYNGQFTGQNGIHSFWESRLPELFSKDYDFFAGRAQYIDDVQKTIWKAVEGSFGAKDSVLGMEKQLSATFPSDRKYELVQKGRTSSKIFSKEYATAYNLMLGGQVERRMRLSVQLVGSLWYTAWVNAGQPDLSDLKFTEVKKKKEPKSEGKMKGREE